MELDQELKQQLKRVLSAVEQMLPQPVDVVDWSATLAAAWRSHSVSGTLEAMPETEGTTLDDLLGIDEQKQLVADNTRQFIDGYPANNILLWGARGTGKSSLVRALLNSYASLGLRIVQVDKDDLHHLPDIFAQIKQQPYRFILFCDDLSFEVGEKSYKILKSVLDGAVYAAPANCLIYVTSNRRYLIPQYDFDNIGNHIKGGEVRASETIEEKNSLSDRFGLWVSFDSFSQDQYLNVVRQCIERLCQDYERHLPWDAEVEAAAIRWSHDKSKRCGRTAYQFSKRWVGMQLRAGSE
ncbi:ATP-binding protein [uncultured Desulfuromonas sp.]|uniref:ATP-binding protein n=1 Tax=uncultured Desulfuromonas sp. TaxID=181013 RepID=UPI002AAB7BB4|nr:ATP-binding protein [uncultured Desulfuromonas sp.]